jgi:hypothetical protein
MNRISSVLILLSTLFSFFSVEVTTESSIPSKKSLDAMRFHCTRVSVANRGGMWVIGKKWIQDKPLFMIVSQCGTLAEVLEVMDYVLKDVKKQL